MKLLPLFLSVILPVMAIGQNFRALEIGGGFSVAVYAGDLSSNQEMQVTLRTAEVAYSLHARIGLTNHVILRLNALQGHLRGDDRVYEKPEWRRTRGFSFSSPLTELSAMGEFYPAGLYERRTRMSRSCAFTRASAFNLRRILPFVMAGVGAAYYNPTVDWNQAKENKTKKPEMIVLDKAARIKGFNLTIPFGAGVRFALNEQITMGLETTFRLAFSDYLDGVSMAGNPKVNDVFYTGGVTLSYVMGRQ